MRSIFAAVAAPHGDALMMNGPSDQGSYLKPVQSYYNVSPPYAEVTMASDLAQNSWYVAFWSEDIKTATSTRAHS